MSKKTENDILLVDDNRELICRINGYVEDNQQYIVLSDLMSVLNRMSGNSISTTKIVIGDLEIFPDLHVVKKRGAEIELRPMEYDLLLYFMVNKNIVLSKTLLIEKGLKQEYIDDNNLMVHISRLRDKIEDDRNKPRYIKTVRKAGYMFVE